MSEFKPGDRVRFTTGPLGAMDSANRLRIVSETYRSGDVGDVVAYPYDDNTCLIAVRPDGRDDLFVPVYEDMIEAV